MALSDDIPVVTITRNEIPVVTITGDEFRAAPPPPRGRIPALLTVLVALAMLIAAYDLLVLALGI